MNAPDLPLHDLLPADLAGQPRRRIVVAMSGGVDSSVAAALLARAGHDVVGITLQLYDHGQATGRSGACCAGQDIHDARRVAEHIGIPHYVLDYESRFRTAVIDAFAESYLAGETPIPCVACNQHIKFRDLLDTARDLGAELMATGHYIDLRRGPAGPELYRARDAARDQSYFLFATTPDQLARLAFPLGHLHKPQVRALATALELPVAHKRDSQDICFVPAGRYDRVIAALRPGEDLGGEIVHIDGRVLGRHDGIHRFTVGQRRGLGIATGEALFVTRIDATARRVVVGPHSELLTTGLELREVNWLGGAELAAQARAGLDLAVRVRSTQAPQPARLVLQETTARVELGDGAHGIARGQACVFYASDAEDARVLGGGIIAATGRHADPAPVAASSVA